MKPLPSYIDGAALIQGEEAAVLARLLPKQAARERLEPLGEPLREKTLAAIDAIHRAAHDWQQRTTDLATEVGTPALPTPIRPAPSIEMPTVPTATASKALGVSPRRVVQMIDAGRIPARREGRTWRIDQAALSLLAAERKAGASDGAPAAPHPTTTTTTEAA